MGGQGTRDVDADERQGRGLLIALGLGLVVACYVFSGALLSGGQAVAGGRDTETWPFLWGFFWMSESIRGGTFPIHTDLMDYPYGGTLWLKEPVFSLLFLPIQHTLGIPWAYTFTQMAHCLVGVAGIYLLGRELGVGMWAAIAAGLVYGFNPHQLGEAYNGNLDAMNIGWAPLWLAAMVAIVRRPGYRPILLGTLALFLLLIGNQYYALAAAALSAPLCLMALIRLRSGSFLRAGMRVAAAVLLGLALFSPFGLALKRSLEAPDQLTFIDGGTPLQPPYVSDAYHLAFPLAITEKTGMPVPFQDIVYQGFILLALAALSLLVARRGAPGRWIFFPLGLMFMSLSLGTVLYYKGEMLTSGGRPIFLPWAYLIVNTPILESMSLSHRMAIPAALCLAMALALCIDGLGRRLGWAGTLAGLLLAAGALVEFFVYPPYALPLATVPTDAPTHTRLLAKTRDALPGAVLNVPLSVQRNTLQRYFWYQSLHGRPIDGSFRVGSWPSLTPKVPLIPKVIAPLMNVTTPLPALDPPPAADPLGLGALKTLGYRFIVFHPRHILFTEEIPDLLPWGIALRSALGPGLQLSDDTVIYPVDPGDRAQLLALAESLLKDDAVVGLGTPWAREISRALLNPHPDDDAMYAIPSDATPYPGEGADREWLSPGVARPPTGVHVEPGAHVGAP